jgi:hypothetical protein
MFNPANAVTFEEADGSALLRGGNISKREGKTTMRRVMRTGSLGLVLTADKDASNPLVFSA